MSDSDYTRYFHACMGGDASIHQSQQTSNFSPHSKQPHVLTVTESNVQIGTYLLQLGSQNMLPVDKKSSVRSYMVTNSHCQHVQ